MRNLALAGLIVLALVACKDNPYEKYEGSWKGSYTGADDSGEWEVSINDEGEVEGTARSEQFPDYPFPLEGVISETGKFDATASFFGQKVEFVGQAQEETASGTWENVTGEFSGKWKGGKQ